MPDVVSRSQPNPNKSPGGRGRRGHVIKFVGSLRGDGVLISSAGETPVRYQLDVFEGGAERTGSGTLDGVMPALPEDEDTARLRLSTGRELTVSLQAVDEQGAMFDTRSAPPLP